MLISENTQSKISDLTTKPPQALLIIGNQGTQVNDVATSLLAKIFDLELEHLMNSPQVLFIGTNKAGSISIETIRQINGFLSLKTTSASQQTDQMGISRAICIFDADKMTVEAQNSLLKNLEEPPKDTIFVLTGTSKHAFLPTVLSRVQIFNVQNPKSADLKQRIASKNSGLSDQELNRIINLADGSQKIIDEIINDPDHIKIQASKLAKDLLSKTTYQKLLEIDNLSKNSTLAKETIMMLSSIAEFSLKSGTKDEKRWQSILLESNKALESIQNNAQIKLVLTQLMLSI